MRKLASIQRIWDIVPIEGADRIELAKVLGWQCVVNKGQFEKYDMCVYFEIDSFLPIKPEFEFLRKSSYKDSPILGEGFRLKTQTFRKQISQGLVLPLTILPEGEYALNQDVTEILGVRKWEIEERATTGGTVVGELPSCVPFTDETRCFVGKTKIITENGLIRISDLVNKKQNYKVLTYNEETQNLEWEKVVGYYKRTSLEPTCTLRFPFRYNSNRTNSITGSLNHPIMTQNGWKKMGDISLDDVVFLQTESYDKDVLQYIAGMLIGDSHMMVDNRLQNDGKSYNKRRIAFSQGEKQLNYLLEKLRILNANVSLRNSKSGYCSNNVYQTSIYIDDTIEEWLYYLFKNSKKMEITSEYIKYLTPISFAFWYMDDGSLHKYNNNSWESHISLATESFTREENELLILRLKDFGVEAKICEENKNNKQYFYIHLNAESTKIFQSLIAGYIFPEMRYKLDDEFKDVEYLLDGVVIKKKRRLIGVHVIDKIIKSPPLHATNNVLYNIETEYNHNYFASGILVHNCQACPALINEFKGKGYYITTKMDGSSHSICITNDGVFHVTGHNYEYKDDGSSSFYEFVKKKDLESKLRFVMEEYGWSEAVVQGEFCAPGIQNNRLRLSEPEWYVFTFILDGERQDMSSTHWIAGKLKVPMVPIEEIGDDFPSRYPTVESVLARADGEYPNGGAKEGIVIRPVEPEYCELISAPLSMKAVNNKYLLKEK